MASQTITALGNAIINLVDRKTPIATANTVGMVKPDGSTINIDANGVISSNGGSSGLEVCDIGMALYVDETKGLRRYLNGQVVDINENTQAFLDRLLQIQTTNPDYFTNEETWQSEATLNVDGCVYKFVLNYDSTGTNVASVRLPKYPDYVEVSAGSSITTAPVTGFVKSTTTSGIVLLPRATLNPNWDGSYALTSNGKYGHFNMFAQDGSGNVSVRNTGSSSVYYVDAQADLSNLKLKNTKLKLYYFIQIATGSETEANIVNTLENVNGFTLLESKYSDKPLYNESWLLSNGQWNSKAVYPTAYEGLQVEYNSEIEAGTTVTLPSGVSYTKRGLSVKLSTETYTDYDFVLNTADESFRLPLKTKLASGKAVVGNGMTLGLTNGEYNLGIFNGSVDTKVYIGMNESSYGAPIGNSTAESTSKPYKTLGITTDPTKSGIELSDSGLYLYFYVGDLDQNHGIVNMGRIGEQLANKQDKLSRYPIEISNKSLMPSWYVVYNDGWCEQGITLQLSASANNTITLLKPYKDMSYQVLIRQNYIETGNVVVLQTEKMTEQTINANLKHAVSNTYYSRSCDFYTYGYIR